MPKIKNSNENSELVAAIAGYMKANGITQFEAARRLGVNKGTMGDWLKPERISHMKLKDVIALGKAAGVPADKLREAAIKY